MLFYDTWNCQQVQKRSHEKNCTFKIQRSLSVKLKSSYPMQLLGIAIHLDYVTTTMRLLSVYSGHLSHFSSDSFLLGLIELLLFQYQDDKNLVRSITDIWQSVILVNLYLIVFQYFALFVTCLSSFHVSWFSRFILQLT